MNATEQILNLSDRWPRIGDRLLVQGNWETSARFADHPIARDSHIWDGYLEAGAALIDECEREPVARFTLIYPILFCYRHGIEAALKWHLTNYGKYTDAKWESNHNLRQLWNAFRVMLEKISGKGDQDAVEAVQSIVWELADLDAGALAFRYSSTKDGATIPLPEQLVDLRNMKDVMTGIGHFFIGADGMLDSLTSSTDFY